MEIESQDLKAILSKKKRSKNNKRWEGLQVFESQGKIKRKGEGKDGSSSLNEDIIGLYLLG